MSLSRMCRSPLAQFTRGRHIHSSTSVWMPRAAPRSKTAAPGELIDRDDMEPDHAEENLDVSSAAHTYLGQQRQLLYYLRIIEHELPQLTAYRRPFIPPDSSRPLAVRSLSYGTEEHPAALKRTIVVPISRLPLKNDAAIHKFKLLAGVRWTPEPPKDSGLSMDEGGGEHGYFKIACEDFPRAAMNLKWASDTLDKLIAEANNSKDTYADVPLDTRHLDAKARKARKGEHARGRGGIRPSIKDFPKEWLPVSPPELKAAPTS